MGDADGYESEDTNTAVSDFPVDTSTTGKHYQVAVPDYLPGTHANSYFRHGVPHSLASAYSASAWPQNGSSVALGDDLLKGVVPPDGFSSSLGGIRDHTDGNRVSTTRNDVLQVIGGQYRQLVLSNQPISDDPDPDWASPSTDTTYDQAEGVDRDPSIVTHEYASWFYELTSTNTQPAAGSYAEPRLKVAEAQTAGYDYYEYANGNNLVDIMAAETALVEKMYAGRMLEVMSTVHASHSDWEGTIGELSDGDLKEYMLGKNITEVIKAEWNINERIEATKGGISELMLAAGGINEVTTAGGAVHEMTAALAISEETVAVLGIHELTAAGGIVAEEILAGAYINEITAAIGPVSEYTLSGAMLTDIMYGSSSFIDVMAAGQMLVEVIAAVMVIEATVATTTVEISMGNKFSYEEHEAHVCDSLQDLAGEVSQIIGNSVALGAATTKVVASMTHICEDYIVV